MRRLQWTERAFADLAELLSYYNDLDPTLGPLFRRRIAIAQRPLLEYPGLGSAVGPHGTRKWRVRRTPFILLYGIRPDGVVQVRSVRHVARDWRAE